MPVLLAYRFLVFAVGGATMASAIVEEQPDGTHKISQVEGDPNELIAGLGVAGSVLSDAFPEGTPSVNADPEPVQPGGDAEEAELLAKLEGVRARRAQEKAEREAALAKLKARDTSPEAVAARQAGTAFAPVPVPAPKVAPESDDAAALQLGRAVGDFIKRAFAPK